MTEFGVQQSKEDLNAAIMRHAADPKRPLVAALTRTLSADLLTPVAAFLALRDNGSHCFLYESVEGGEKLARYSFIGRNPYLIVRGAGRSVVVEENGRQSHFRDGDIFDALKYYCSRYDEIRFPGLPRLTGGAVGFFSYDTVRLIENIPDSNPDVLGLPDALWCFYDTVIAFDHVKHQIIIMSNLFIDDDSDFDAEYDRAATRIDDVVRDLARHPNLPEPVRMSDAPMESNFEKREFCDAVTRAKELIREGDIFQVVLSQRFSKPYEGDDFNLYRALRQVNPSPYLFYLDQPGFSIIGSSPELLVRVENGRAETLPIAGTRPRGATAEEDVRLADELLSDPKELAEHVMLVDLGRNDLSRVCNDSSVTVDDFAYVERFSHVMHIVSSVSGTLRPDQDSMDALKACFPAGTVSGAPKVRAMEIIDSMEPTRRGVYAGAVGYLDYSGNLDTCIAIRTMVAKDGVVYVQAGAGIVADSNPEAEFEETRNKARALDHAMQIAARNLI